MYLILHRPYFIALPFFLIRTPLFAIRAWVFCSEHQLTTFNDFATGQNNNYENLTEIFNFSLNWNGALNFVCLGRNITMFNILWVREKGNFPIILRKFTIFIQSFHLRLKNKNFAENHLFSYGVFNSVVTIINELNWKFLMSKYKNKL